LAKSTRFDLRNILSALFTFAKESRLWDGENPAAGVEVGRGLAVHEEHLLGSQELQRFLGEIDETTLLTKRQARALVLLSRLQASGRRRRLV
jgi:integrase